MESQRPPSLKVVKEVSFSLHVRILYRYSSSCPNLTFVWSQIQTRHGEGWTYYHLFDILDVLVEKSFTLPWIRLVLTATLWVVFPLGISRSHSEYLSCPSGS